MKKKLPVAWLITDSKITDPVTAVKNLPRNCGVILRDYDLDEEQRFELGKILKKICAEKKLVFIVARDAELALRLKADGIHLPEYAAYKIHRWRAKKPGWIITAATHTRRAVKFAYHADADAVLISPLFPTSSHHIKKPLGLFPAIHFIYRDVKAYGLGGVTPNSAKALKALGFCGFAGISWGKDCVGSATVGSLTAKKYQII